MQQFVDEQMFSSILSSIVMIQLEFSEYVLFKSSQRGASLPLSLVRPGHKREKG